MKEQILNRTKLGAFVLLGTACLLLGLYYIGSKKNIFHSTISVSANFSNVGGLMPGNNVRFNGINVGTVSKVFAIADTAIKVEFTIEQESTTFITQSAFASIGTDGLLGNKLIDISPGKNGADPIMNNFTLKSLNPIQIDNTLRTLTLSNDNLKVITDNLKDVTEKFNTSNSLWHLLSDSIIAENIRTAIVQFKITGNNTAMLTGDLRKIVLNIKSGKGTVGTLLTDTLFSRQLKEIVVNMKVISDSVLLISGDFKNISGQLRKGKGAIGTLLTDTTFVNNLNKSMKNIKDGSGNFNENMQALKHSWPFKKYFKQKVNK